MRSALRLHCTDADSSHIITNGLARYIDNVIYQKSYKMWRCQPPKNNTPLKQKMSQSSSIMKPTPNSTSQQSSTTTTTSSSSSREMGTDTKLVKFENETLSPKQSSYLYRTITNESTILRSHKKSRAPQPPISTTSCTTCTTTINIPSTDSLKFNSDQITYSLNPIIKPTSNVTLQSKLKQNVYEKKSSQLCRTCGLCFINLPTVDKTINSKTIQPIVSCSTETEITTMYTTMPTPTSVVDPTNYPQSIMSQSTSYTSTKQHSSSCLHQQSTHCWPIIKQSTLLKSSIKFNTNKSIYNQYTTYQLCNKLCLCIKYFFTLLCLLPICLYYWLCNRQKKIKKLHHHHHQQQQQYGHCHQHQHQHHRHFLFYFYVTIKLLYVINIFSQLYLMQIFLGVKSYFFGIYTLNDLIHGNVWSETGHFPRITYCDFEAKKLGKNYKYTLQCVLPLNLFLEKVYVFLWFWFVFVGCLTVYSLLKWLTRLTLTESRYNFISRFLQSWYDTHQHLGELDNVKLKLFVNNYLNLDGVFLLWLISINANDLIINELIIALWNLFEIRLSALKSSLSSSALSLTSSKVAMSTNHNIMYTSHPYDHILDTSNLLHNHHHQQQQHHHHHQCKSTDHSFTSIYPISQSTFNDHNDSTLRLNNVPLSYPQKFYSCCPVTKFSETIHLNNNNNNNNNNINIYHSTDTFESSDSIV
ncbi:hypothetical protein MN116_006599 [Schistosoma mekongi]|uniref:Innexin n=1 Tax=Schistosoma mekongi TaxID=38744 RepID=A0AAE1Z9S5_SCHME|nr:hypothetical protein MN116_006599 [Schistosoma mekongi]